ncbi:MAG: phosphopantetheine-binding protein [Pseudomonadota bacterium]
MPDDLVGELKKLIIETLKLEEITPEKIEDDGQLFGDGLGLDSIDALELVVALEKTYGVVIPDSEVGERVFRSVNTLAQFVREQSTVLRK